MKVPEARDMIGPEVIKRELIAEYWRVKVPTTEIALAMGIDEAEVCRVIEAIEQQARESGAK
jgi:hypothetical protein